MTLIERLLDPAILGVMIPIAAILVFGGLLIFDRWTKHRERMAMIDMGMHPDHPPVEREDDLDALPDGREEIRFTRRSSRDEVER
jgi:hypothetical protein